MRKEIDVDVDLSEMTIYDLLDIMAGNKSLKATLQCEGFNIHVEIEPTEEEDDYED